MLAADPTNTPPQVVESPEQAEAATDSVSTTPGSPDPITTDATQQAPSPNRTNPAPITPTAPAGIPIAAIQILRPGQMSLVTSPFLLQANLRPEAGGHIQIELLGEDGRLLMRKVQIYSQSPGARLDAPFEVNFEVSGVAETARLQVSVVDEHSHTAALASIDLLLLSLGEPSQNPPGDLLESIVIHEPKANALVQGGMLRVSGLARPRSDLPLMIELRTDDAKIVGNRQVAVERSGDGQYGAFAIDVPYSVSSATPVQLVVWERGAQIPGIVHLSSLEVLLSP